MARVEFALPDVGEGLEEGEVVSWLVAPGDTVARDQPLVEVQTDKALVELPSPVAGQVVSLAFAPGDIVKVGQVLVVLEDGPGPTQAPPPAPTPIRASAINLQSQGITVWRDLLGLLWRSSPDFQPFAENGEALLASMFLQPLAEFVADRSTPEPRGETLAICPLCNGRPLVGVLRPEGDGAKRSLICSRCATEWAFRRIVCPACGEEMVEKLAIYTAEQFAHVRVEACDTCRFYIKTVDLTKNGLALPEVDDLASIPLTLWPEDNSYEAIAGNVLGV